MFYSTLKKNEQIGNNQRYRVEKQKFTKRSMSLRHKGIASNEVVLAFNNASKHKTVRKTFKNIQIKHIQNSKQALVTL